MFRLSIGACCVCFQYGSIFQAHPFLSSAPFAFTRCDVFFVERFGVLLFLGHASYPFSSGRAKLRNESTLLIGISLECCLRL
ncbi:hypothetical protein SBA3_1460011 [Candidatus Sulfopaludibacter sp. SbA3]|nr:hypothetical protein SBA3_1460011 [Candidatus Sulfopaludibacter sp. SbA3]